MKKQALKKQRIQGQYRQGDVLVFDRSAPLKVGKEIPRENDRVVLAHGEVTGHAHAINSAACSLYLDDSVQSAPDAMALIGIAGGLIRDRALIATEPVELRHEEHGTVTIPASQKTVRVQVQWDPSARISQVAD